MTTNTTADQFIGIDDVLQMLPGMTRTHLAQMRYAGQGPAFYKPSKRTVLYKKSDVLEWLESTRCTSTAEGK